MDIIDSLMRSGFSKHESVLYLTLCREGELTGYEAAKISGLPRSNAYLALAGLVDKGGAFRIDADVVKYLAVPVKEMVFNLRRHLNDALDYIEENVPMKETPKDPYITIKGKGNIINKMKHTINSATERIYISISDNDFHLFEKDVVGARDRGLKVVIITSPGFKFEGVVIYHNIKQIGQIRLITDTSNVITGEILGEEDSTCLYSRNKNLIQLIKDSLTNEIKLIEIQKNKGDSL
jgi:HTH-type transcriptional regulator, sugar sensing transcriptional regulator